MAKREKTSLHIKFLILLNRKVNLGDIVMHDPWVRLGFINNARVTIVQWVPPLECKIANAQNPLPSFGVQTAQNQFCREKLTRIVGSS